jgi:ribosome biogenesis GTPase
MLRLQGEAGPIDAVLGGSLRHHAEGAAELPTVGDWVVATRPSADGPAVVEAVLPRRSKISRKVPGRRAVEQVLAANVDVAFLMMGLDQDFNLRRLERFLAMVEESGARPVVLLNKADVADDVERLRGATEDVAPDVAVHAISARAGDIADVERHLASGVTAVLLGSSGVGKSTLVNRLLGSEAFATGEIRARDGRGQHTTTHRELVRLPGGGLLIDGPGIREVQLWSDEGLEDAFPDVEALASDCRFRDCRHEGEPGCAVEAAAARGDLDPARLASFRVLQRETAALARRRDVRSQRATDRAQGKLYKRIQEEKGKRGEES